jgi:hypothetical protein
MGDSNVNLIISGSDGVTVGRGVDVGWEMLVEGKAGLAVAAMAWVGVLVTEEQLEKNNEITKIREYFFILSCLRCVTAISL